MLKPPNPPLLIPSMASRSLGFTLIEIVIAVGLMAVISVLSWQALSSLTRASQALEQEYQYASRMEKMFSIMEGDISQLLSPHYLPNIPYLAVINDNNQPNQLGLLRVNRLRYQDQVGPLMEQMVLYRLNDKRIERLVSVPTTTILPNPLTEDNALTLIENVDSVSWKIYPDQTQNGLTPAFFNLQNADSSKYEDFKRAVLPLITLITGNDAVLSMGYDPVAPKLVEIQLTVSPPNSQKKLTYSRVFLVGSGI